MKREAVIFDMDGTLANVSGIRHWIRRGHDVTDSP